MFRSILVPLDGSHTAAGSIGVAAWLAGRLDARLHVLSATPHPQPAQQELKRLGVDEAAWPRVMLHQAAAYPEDAILDAITRYDVDLVIMTARGSTAEAASDAAPDPLRIVGHVTLAVIQRCPVPVLVLPPAYREALPWKRMLVPVSGEVEADEALTLALHIANALELFVDVVHVADADEAGIAGHARYADAVYYEYPSRLQEFVTHAASGCSPEECQRIEGLSLCRGDVAAELLDIIQRKRISLIVVGWHGRFMTGHAPVLKRLIQTITCPVLLMKAVPRPEFKLHVGEEIE
jgi:nucleotide-binding universal stress UspA family protein